LPNYPRRKDKGSQRLAAVPDSMADSPKLTKKQEAFANLLLDGIGAVEAYRLAYNASNMGKNSLAVEASRLSRNAKIAQYIRSRQRLGLANALINKDNHLSELGRLRELAIENQQISAGVQAEHYRGRVAGLYNDKLALTVGPSDESILSQLAALLGPEVATLVGDSLKGETAASGEREGAQGNPPDGVLLALPAPYDSK
jgi:phage terminase small subunit